MLSYNILYLFCTGLYEMKFIPQIHDFDVSHVHCTSKITEFFFFIYPTLTIEL
jgi:hypothetical protein